MKNADLLTIIEDQIFIGDSLDDLDTEIAENLWLISMSKEERSEFSVEDLVSFYNKLIAQRSEQVKAAGKHSMIFYTWHDAQASQLRFCLISDFHSKLPFGTELQNATLEEIIAEFLASNDGIPFSELTIVEKNSPVPETGEIPKLKVFQKRIP